MWQEQRTLCPMDAWLYPTRIPSSEMRPLTKGREKKALLSGSHFVGSSSVCQRMTEHLQG